MGTPSCETSTDLLQQQVRMAFRNNNINALGSLFLWRGYSTGAAYTRMNQLLDLLNHNLVELRLSDPAPMMPGPRSQTNQTELELILVAPGMGTRRLIRRFPIVHVDGCHWLRFAPAERTPFH